MCCSIGNEKALFTNTKLYVGEATFKDKYVHVLAYQNNAKTDGPNAMILPFPTDKAMGPNNVIDTSKFKSFLNDISEASKIRRRSKGYSDDLIGGVATRSVAQVFDVGSYTVILADHVKQVPEALTRVVEDRRPKATTRFLIGYDNLYHGQPVALCCWNGHVEAEPLLWWYEPSDPNVLFIPTMDAHDGNPPNTNVDVETDHIISVGSVLTIDSAIPSLGNKVHYTEDLGEFRKLLPDAVYGTKLDWVSKNGDCFVHVEELSSFQSKTPYPILRRGVSNSKIDSQQAMQGWSS